MQTNAIFSVALITALVAGCGAQITKKAGGGGDSSGDSAPDASAAGGTSSQGTTGTGTNANRDATAAGNADLIALGPQGIGVKVLAAFGPNMTSYTVKGMQMDYLQVNAGLFTGAISPNPYTTIPAQLESVSYFMAVAGLSQVVANNYAAALASGSASAIANDCTKEAGAEAMARIIYPPMTDDEIKTIGASIVKSCTQDGIAPSVLAIIDNLAFLLKSES